MIGGMTPDERLVELIELPDHPWFVACQYHPEFKSRPTRPHPLFRDFIGAAIACGCGVSVPAVAAEVCDDDGGSNCMSALPAPSRERLTELFLGLTAPPSPSRDERLVADAVIPARGCGRARPRGRHRGGHRRQRRQSVVYWCGETAIEPHLALGAHLDTVEPTDAIEPVLDETGCSATPGGPFSEPTTRSPSRRSFMPPNYCSIRGVRSPPTSCSSPSRRRPGW